MRLRIGGRTVDRDKAFAHARSYLTRGHGWAYPSYDGFEWDQARGPLTDADFLAPVLLNVPHMSVTTYEGLQAEKLWLDHRLSAIPEDLTLVDAQPQHLELLGELFSILDARPISGVKGTVLSKVLHRKRPHFIPLYDEQVRSVYQDGDDAPVPLERGRAWSRFYVLFAEAVQKDLRREFDFWSEIAEFAPEPPVSPLRALDIVAWWAGRR